MAQAYTVRQLDFFRSTLKILESAIFETEVALNEAVRLQDVAEAELRESVLEPDASSVNSSYFSVLPQRANLNNEIAESATDLITPPIEAVITLEGVKNSALFFQALPWQGHKAELSEPDSDFATPPAFENLAVAKQESPVILKAETQNLKTCAQFFQTLPWQSQTSVTLVSDNTVFEPSPELTTPQFNEPSADFFQTLPWTEQAVSKVNTENKADIGVDKATPTLSTCAKFFRALPWQGATTIIENITQTIADKQQTESANQQTSKDFFQALPWHSKTTVIDDNEILIATVIDDYDFATMSEFATQSALQAARQNKTPLPIIQKTASGFFQSLPW